MSLFFHRVKQLTYFLTSVEKDALNSAVPVQNTCNLANIRLDEDVLKTSFVFVFRRRLQDVLIKTNVVALFTRLQKTSSRRLQDVLKTSSKRLAKTSSRHLQDVFQRCLQDVFKTYHQVKLFA